MILCISRNFFTDGSLGTFQSIRLKNIVVQEL